MEGYRSTAWLADLVEEMGDEIDRLRARVADTEAEWKWRGARQDAPGGWRCQPVYTDDAGGRAMTLYGTLSQSRKAPGWCPGMIVDDGDVWEPLR